VKVSDCLLNQKIVIMNTMTTYVFKASPQHWGTLSVGSASARACMVSTESAKASIWRDRHRMDAPGGKSDAIPVISSVEGER
jgi:hypothetical protein